MVLSFIYFLVYMFVTLASQSQLISPDPGPRNPEALQLYPLTKLSAQREVSTVADLRSRSCTVCRNICGRLRTSCSGGRSVSRQGRLQAARERRPNPKSVKINFPRRVCCGTPPEMLKKVAQSLSSSTARGFYTILSIRPTGYNVVDVTYLSR